MPMYHRWRHMIVAIAVVTPLFLLPLQFARSAAPLKDQLPARSAKAIPKDQLPVRSVKAIPKAQLPVRAVKAIPKDQLPVRSVKAISKAQLPIRAVKAVGISTLQPESLRLPNTAIEPIEWNALNGWKADNHTAAFATFLTSCRPLLRASVREGDKRLMYLRSRRYVVKRLPLAVSQTMIRRGYFSNTISARCA